ncbi:hypothetical protein AX14_001441 [Amanita brunnescens Koide BX004]|nr:hypothetical protein AX14_001441 [Amanita brunnescens Koide BX004]
MLFLHALVFFVLCTSALSIPISNQTSVVDISQRGHEDLKLIDRLDGLWHRTPDPSKPDCNIVPIVGKTARLPNLNKQDNIVEETTRLPEVRKPDHTILRIFKGIARLPDPSTSDHNILGIVEGTAPNPSKLQCDILRIVEGTALLVSVQGVKPLESLQGVWERASKEYFKTRSNDFHFAPQLKTNEATFKPDFKNDQIKFTKNWSGLNTLFRKSEDCLSNCNAISAASQVTLVSSTKTFSMLFLQVLQFFLLGTLATASPIFSAGFFSSVHRRNDESPTTPASSSLDEQAIGIWHSPALLDEPEDVQNVIYINEKGFVHAYCGGRFAPTRAALGKSSRWRRADESIVNQLHLDLHELPQDIFKVNTALPGDELNFRCLTEENHFIAQIKHEDGPWQFVSPDLQLGPETANGKNWITHFPDENDSRRGKSPMRRMACW